MVALMSLEEQVDKDFAAAHRRAFFGWVTARLRGRPYASGLPAFEEARRDARAISRVRRGRRVVEVSKIVGSVGRHREFDRCFMPTRASATRWKRIDRAFHRMCDLPPVCLFEISGRYFVFDGHHRVSVARYQRVETVEADVMEFRPGAGRFEKG